MQVKLFITQAEALRLADALSRTIHPNCDTFNSDKILLNNLKTFGGMILQAEMEKE
jgi:hypothetical protein